MSLSSFLDLLCRIAIAGCREILCWIVEELKAVAMVTVLTTIYCLLQSPWPENWLSVML